MKNTNMPQNLADTIDHYYQYNPDTLLPLLMVALATRKELYISYKKERRPFACVQPAVIYDYDWVRLDARLNDRICEDIGAERQYISVGGKMNDAILKIFKIFHHYDTFTVEQEFHHRLGILYQHSSKEPSEQAHRQYATIRLAEELIATEQHVLQEYFIIIANKILVKSGLQPERPRIEVARTLCKLLNYDRKGIVYNPFAGCGITAALIMAGEKLYADGDVNPKLTATAQTLIYGMGGSSEHFIKHDSTKWIKNQELDYVVSTYRGYIKGQSAFDFCLRQCFDTLSPTGKFAGIIAPKDIFEKQSKEMIEAIHRDWLETIVLLPFGEVAVLINANKDKALKEKIIFYNMHSNLLCNKNIVEVLSNKDNAHLYPSNAILDKGFLKNLIVQPLPDIAGKKLVRFGDFVTNLPRKSFELKNSSDHKYVLASFNRKKTYDPYGYSSQDNIDKHEISSLFGPAFFLNAHCILTNMDSNLEPRIYDAESGSAYFQDGFAFYIKDQSLVTASKLALRLQGNIIEQQLHPYGKDPLLPEYITEEQILNLQFYINEDIPIGEREQNLSPGVKLTTGNFVYTIHKFLDRGGYGYTYTAEEHNLNTGFNQEVVIKEYFPDNICHRERQKILLDSPLSETDYEKWRKHFLVEAEIMHTLGAERDSHIAPSYNDFHSDETDTDYYVMPFYRSGSILDSLNKGEEYTESIIINQVVIPMCKALHIAHHHRILHLDVKLDNIMIDDDGNAILIDFGMANQYDEKGNVIYKSEERKLSAYVAPELQNANMSHFAPQPDVYGLAYTLYEFVTYEQPKAIYSYGDTDKILARKMRNAHCSKQFIEAVLSGLRASPEVRPATIEDFLHLFPNCENLIL